MIAPSREEASVPSLLDMDLYKFTMQQAVLTHFPGSSVQYKFRNRSKDVLFSRKCLDLFKVSVAQLEDVALTIEERQWLRDKCPYFSDTYLDFLSSFRFRPNEQVTVTFLPKSDEEPGLGQIEIDIQGFWKDTILYEILLMAALSNAFFHTDDTDWSYEGQEELAYQKGVQFFRAGIVLSEFGTRRRRSLEAQKLAIEGLMRANKEPAGVEGILGELTGTSNVHLARLYDLTPIGTIAHEWPMGIAALHGYESPNALSLSLWEDVYPPTPSSGLLALTDTFTSEVFFSEFIADPDRARRWKGLRQDSGDPVAWAVRAKEVYEKLGIDWTTKVVVFSDALNLQTALDLHRQVQHLGFLTSYGIGTSLTNDFRSNSTGERSKPLNIVIKLASIDGRPCVKLSDDAGKNMGDPHAIREVRKRYGLGS